MDNFRFYAPTEVIFGKDTEDRTGEIAAKYGSPALLGFGKDSVKKSGLLARVEDSLSAAGMGFLEFGGAQPNPTLSHAEEGVQEAIGFQADVIIGVGGGSSIDTAKAIAHGTANPDIPLWDIWTQKIKLEKSLPVGAVLTMPAAGSEMSDSAVLTNKELSKKKGLSTDFNRCRFAIMDPLLGGSLPPYQVAAGVTDIMMHTMERYFIPDITCELTDEIAEGLLRTVIKNGRIVVNDPSNYDAMCEIFWASSLSHNGLTECGRGKDFSIHKLGHALTVKYGVTHGASLAAVWNAWANELYMECIPRFARFARKVWQIDEADDVKAAKQGIDKTAEFFKSIGMPICLADLRVSLTDEDADELALDATMQDTVKLSRIRPLDAAAVRKIFEAAL